jgi:proline dehydrogenase
MLDDAKHALSHGDPGRALSILDEFDREFRGARLGPEAAVLRVEALFDLGRNDEARRLGQRLIASQPDSAHVQRLRSLLEAAQTARGNATP